VDWQQRTYTLTNGTHQLEWTYSKNDSVSVGSDCGWVDGLALPVPTSPPPTLVIGWSNGTPQLNIAGPVGSSIVLQTSSNLTSWSVVSTSAVPASGLISTTDPSFTNQPMRFYRGVLP
jgi:hypothetical protein